MRTTSTLGLAALLGATMLAGTARAQPDYVTYIPNGLVNDCENCHPGGNTQALNGFGQASSDQVGKPSTQWWPALIDLDSDGDGQTNGQELGDPCGDWLIGLDPPRTTAIANPGDPASKSADPDNPSCDGGGGAGGAPGTGGASTGPGPTTGAGGSTGAGNPGSGAGPGSSAMQSTGAGLADPPLAVPSSCAMSGATNPATPGAAWDIGVLAGAAIALALHRRRKRP